MEKFYFWSNRAVVDKKASFCITFSWPEKADSKAEDFLKNSLKSDISQGKISEVSLPEKQSLSLQKQLSTVILPALKSGRDACFYKVCYNQNQEREV